jgi:hypothetical protein
MKDLKLDRQRPWEGPGRDPRGDRWGDDNMEEDDVDHDQDEDVDLGPCSLSTPLIDNLRAHSTK